ncbi:SDR family NAD(P)-dependent oxidoreductase [Halorientalis salina]|uniref:SDR family NAD(P)-dependent oxidoreductase n=1 Tax=Halorientalis salina TaxID=2932266 RepID=UPI0010AD5827|nr:SDR family NAD(P)-dependent oxidoreductase [Halorientalis salina]
MSDTARLDGDVALVTGASSGIGRATAQALAAEGAAVAVAARREERLAELVDDIEDAGGTALAVPTDITETDEVREMVETTREELGGLDILVNNAGVMLLAPVIRADVADLQQMLDVNLKGLMTATREALPGLLDQDEGHIVNISSVAGRTANEASAGYSATKFGVNAFSESLRKEVTDSGVRVTVVEPGAVETELGEHIPDEQVRERLSEMVGEMTVLQPDDIASAITYAVTQPPRVSVNELLIRPTEQQ